MFALNDLRWVVPTSIVVGIATLVVVGGLLKKFMTMNVFLQGPKAKLPVQLIDREIITHDTILFTFRYSSTEIALGLPAGNYVNFHARINAEKVKRPYTPLEVDNTNGYVKCLIKIYRKKDNFPCGGIMSQYLERLELNDWIDMSGPLGHIHYLGNGEFEVKGARTRKLSSTHINMICGGSGLTPMYQIIKCILNSPSDKTKVSILFANATETDIPMRDELDQICYVNSDQFRVWYTIVTASDFWRYSVGYIDRSMLECRCYPAGDDTVTLVGGPPLMTKNAVLPNLADLKHDKDRILLF